MSQYSAVFLRVDGAEEANLGYHDLAADTVDGAIEEARTKAPKDANFIKILLNGVVLGRPIATEP